MLRLEVFVPIQNLMSNKSMKLFSQYNIIARIFPTIIGLIPLFIFQYVFLNNLFNIDSFVASIASNISLSTILLYTFNQYCIRIPSKLFEDWMFDRQLHFPSTDFLMYSNDEYTDDFKNQIRISIKNDFSIDLPNKEQENENEKQSRKKIKEAIRLIIGKVKDGYLVLQHNIEYGFSRNLWGASLVGILGSLLILNFSNSTGVLHNVGIILIVMYSIYTLFGFVVIKYFSRSYARKLIEEYYKTSHDK